MPVPMKKHRFPVFIGNKENQPVNDRLLSVCNLMFVTGSKSPVQCMYCAH